MIKTVFLIAGIYDLEEIPKTSINLALKLDKSSAVDLSPFHSKTFCGFNTQFFIFSAENDSPVFKKQAFDFYEKIKSLVKCKFIEVSEVDHFDIIELLFVKEDFQVSVLITNSIE